MPYRDRTTVERWVDEFRARHDAGTVAVEVLDENFEAGPDSGIVVVTLRSVNTITFLHPMVLDGAPVWIVTFEARSQPIDLEDDGLRLLAQDIATVSDLRAHLQSQTDALLLAR